MGFNLTQLVVDVEPLLVIYYHSFIAQLTHVMAPKDEALDFLITEPAMFLLPSHHLPLARPWDLVFMMQVS